MSNDRWPTYVTVKDVGNGCYPRSSPHYITIPIDRSEAVEIIYNLAQFLRSPEEKYELTYSCTLKFDSDKECVLTEGSNDERRH